MPRTLPWLVDAAKKKESRKVKQPSSPKREHDSGSEDLVDSDLNAIRDVSSERKPRRRPNRTPSTSPPPAPPDVEFMREGYNADDIYMMVEDEFLTTAKMFTQHIHHAEYVRLKKLARSRGAERLQAVSRPTDGKTEQSNGLRMKLEAAEKQQKLRDGMRKLDSEGESSEDEDEYLQDPQLAGLMTADSQIRKDLSELTKTKSNTRAAAGFLQSPHNVERKRDALADNPGRKAIASASGPGNAMSDDVYSEDSEDDLDAAPPKHAKRTVVKTANAKHQVNGASYKDIKAQTPSESSKTFSRFAKSTEDERRAGSASMSSTARMSGQEIASEPLKSDEASSRGTQSAISSDYLAKRKAEKERKEREEKRKTRNADDIPTFLI